MYRQGVIYAISAAGYLYSLIIVDLYRKLVGVNVEVLRNFIYIFFFALLVFDMYRSKRLRVMLGILVITILLFLGSILINPGYSSVYSAAIMLFVSRLWPAFYIGRYTENWRTLCKVVIWLSPISFVYSVSLFIIPDIASGEAYATIASNLAFVSMISLFASLYFRKIFFIPIAFVCLIPVFFYGTRAFFLGVTVSLLLAYVINGNRVTKSKRILLIFFLLVICFLFYVVGDAIFHQLYLWFPDSRTLQMIALGDFMDDSNRSLFYNRIIDHLYESPFSMSGLIGDRIYLSTAYASADEILSNFSHNCMLELCMNFGLPLGVILNVYFIRVIIKALRNSLLYHNTIHYVFVLFLGAGFVDMMLSASYMGSYIPWFLFGLAFCIYKNKFVKDSY